ncbi:hypothetical protein VNO78_28647 [Psophocarpus tetragonolobus]|uniref:Uncharacterized protein n=1 Tax=Psophocarpus tetragonolobus TaxID=3891 RepID=A0AAN9RTK1_PSOTE
MCNSACLLVQCCCPLLWPFGIVNELEILHSTEFYYLSIICSTYLKCRGDRLEITNKRDEILDIQLGNPMLRLTFGPQNGGRRAHQF